MSSDGYHRTRGVADSFRRTGLRFGTCRHCGQRIAWNALALGAHLRGKRCEEKRAAPKPSTPETFLQQRNQP